MKRCLQLTLLALFATGLTAQTAVTESGDIVVLHENGTWEYQEKSKNLVVEETEETFSKPETAKFSLKSSDSKAGVWVDTKKWKITKGATNEDADYEFSMRDDSDVYGMMITEGVEMTSEALLKLALDNAREFAPNAKLIYSKYCVVNGVKVIKARIDGTGQGVKFSYLTLYHGGPGGATQLVTYTGTNLVDKFEAEMDALLNGFVLQEGKKEEDGKLP